VGLAEGWYCRFVDLVDEPPDPDLVRSYPDEVMAREGWVPIARSDAVVRVATCEHPTPERRAAIEGTVRARVLFEVTTDWDVQHAISEVFAERLATRRPTASRSATRSSRPARASRSGRSSPSP